MRQDKPCMPIYTIGMQTDDPHNVSSSTKEPSLAYKDVEHVLRARLRDSIAPLSLEVDCLALKKWAKVKTQERFRHHALIKELRLWSKHLQRKPVNRIWLNSPLSIMDAPSLTELVYGIGHNLKLQHSHHVEHAITLDCKAINRQNIALLRGLEFNHIQINLTRDCDLEEAQRIHRSLEEFKFSFISFELEVNQDPSADAMRIMEHLSFLSPTALRLYPTPLDLSNLDKLTPALMQFGYYFQAPNIILKFHSPLHTPPADCVRLGPQTYSQLCGLEFTHLASPDHYQNYLDNDLLPISHWQYPMGLKQG